MAWLERKGTKYRIRFRFGGRKHLVVLKTTKERDANGCLARFEENLRLAERGRLVIPDDADVGLFLLSDGKLNQRPQDEQHAEPVTLGKLFAQYQANSPTRAKEDMTRYTERIHIAHLERLIGRDTKLNTISAKVLQAYVTARSGEKGNYGRTISTQTIKKELGTLTAVWNQWAIPQELAAAPLPTRWLVFAKKRSRPPFQTREQIERQLASSELSPDEQAALWDCLFLTLPETDEVLKLVRNKNCAAFIYPLFVFAAHTGARRSEMLRARVSDFDFDANVITIREKKRDRDIEETYRNVPMTPVFGATFREWFANHPGGNLAICALKGRPLPVQTVAHLFVRVLRNSKWSVLPGWHCFRHSFISNCVAKGVDQRLIDQWVGHTTEAMRRRYSHLIPKTSQDALRTVFGENDFAKPQVTVEI